MYAVVANCHFNGLSIIQELGRKGVDVRAFDSVRSVGTTSKYASYERCPNPGYDESEFIKFLLQYGAAQNRRGVIFPTNDHWAVAISKHRDTLSSYYEVVAPPFSAMQTIIQKNDFYCWAEKNGFPVPQTWKLKFGKILRDDAFPLVGKPEFRRTASNDATSTDLYSYLDRNRFVVLNNADELSVFAEKHKLYADHFVLQRYVQGLSDAMFTVGVYVDKSSTVRAVFSGRKVRGFPPDHGDCIVGQVEGVPEHLIDITKDICKRLGFTGIAEFEFKRDSISGQYFLIEVNPRSWSWIGITPYCGVSLPWLAYQDLIGKEIPNVTKSAAKDGSIKYVKLFQDFENCMWKNKGLGFSIWSYSFRDWLRSLKADKIVVAEFQVDDLFPSIYCLFNYVKSSLSSILRFFIK